jgi:hypothetical protein
MILGWTFTTFLDVFIVKTPVLLISNHKCYSKYEENEYIGWILRYGLIVVCMNVTNKILSNAMNVRGIID